MKHEFGSKEDLEKRVERLDDEIDSFNSCFKRSNKSKIYPDEMMLKIMGGVKLLLEEHAMDIREMLQDIQIKEEVEKLITETEVSGAT